jgi:hypothetical protein
MYLARLASGGKFGKKLSATNASAQPSSSSSSSSTSTATSTAQSHYASTNGGPNQQHPKDFNHAANIKKSMSVLATNSTAANGSNAVTTAAVQKCLSPMQGNTSSSNLSIKSVEKLLEEAAYSGHLILSTKKLKEFPKSHQQYDLLDTIHFGRFKIRPNPGAYLIACLLV